MSDEASAPRGGRPRDPDVIMWPAGTHPDDSDVFAHNERIVAAEPERVWSWLVAAPLWPQWYANSGDVRLRGRQRRLHLRTLFRWRTFGVTIKSEVDQFDPPHRIGWLWARPGARGYHGWVIEQHPDGSRVVTEETQRGPVPALLWPLLRPALYLSHAWWLRQLARWATRGTPREELGHRAERG